MITGRTTRRKPRAAPAFSLAEVLIALAITAFALLALIGVLPEGLQSLQNAQRQEAEARIVQQVAAMQQLKPWDETNTSVPQQTDLDFDGNGAPVQAGSKDAVYHARAEVTDAAPLPNESTASPYLRRLRIRITSQSVGGFDDPLRYREKWVTLVNLDKARPESALLSGQTPAENATTPNP